MVTEIYDMNLQAYSTPVEVRRVRRRESAEDHNTWTAEHEVVRAIGEGVITESGTYAVVKYSPDFLDSIEMHRVCVGTRLAVEPVPDYSNVVRMARCFYCEDSAWCQCDPA